MHLLYLIARRVFERMADLVLSGLRPSRGALIDGGLPTSHFYESPRLGAALVTLSRNYLTKSGWLNSRAQRRSVDRKGFAVPWLTYPAIHFLESKDLSEFTMVEFGGGASTPFFSRRCERVITVETDDNYLESLRKLELDNVHFFDFGADAPRITPPAERYESAAAKDAVFEDSSEISKVHNSLDRLAKVVNTADIILIDGGPRWTYALLVSQFAKRDAIIVVDNSDMPVLGGLVDVLAGDSHLRIPFFGLGPLNPYGWETTILWPWDKLGSPNAIQ